MKLRIATSVAVAAVLALGIATCKKPDYGKVVNATPAACPEGTTLVGQNCMPAPAPEEKAVPESAYKDLSAAPQKNAKRKKEPHGTDVCAAKNHNCVW